MKITWPDLVLPPINLWSLPMSDCNKDESLRKKLIEQEEQIPPHIKWLNANNINGCIHRWVYQGHGHNYDHYKCSICGFEGEY